MSLTPKQMRLLVLIRDYINRLGYSPTYGEMGEMIGRHKVTAYELVQQLIYKGAIASDERRWHHSLSLTPAAVEMLSHREAGGIRLRFMGEINGTRPNAKIERAA